ncbi:MAG: hypothetical protein WDW38_009483 [Sanguina aurantia]
MRLDRGGTAAAAAAAARPLSPPSRYGSGKAAGLTRFSLRRVRTEARKPRQLAAGAGPVLLLRSATHAGAAVPLAPSRASIAPAAAASAVTPRLTTASGWLTPLEPSATAATAQPPTRCCTPHTNQHLFPGKVAQPCGVVAAVRDSWGTDVQRGQQASLLLLKATEHRVLQQRRQVGGSRPAAVAR